MVFRLLIRYLANNERLIQRMADSYPMRRAAQFVVSIWYRTKNRHEVKEITPERFKSFFNMFKNNLKQEIEDAKTKLKEK